jgi:hypothetical protein
LRRRHQFHDVTLSGIVDCARQALASDEPRMKFEPCLWDAVAGGTADDPRVRQVWFEGCHSDVGGGYADSGLSDTALLWMVAEASRQGLVFDEALLQEYLACGRAAVRHDPMTLTFRILDLAIRIKIRLHIADGRAFLGKRRRLHRPDCVSVRIAQPAVEHFQAAEDYHPDNLAAWAEECQLDGSMEPLIGLPEKSYARIGTWLDDEGVTLGPPVPGQSLPAERSPDTASDNVT